MPLQSALFRGDRALEACLTQDAAHLTPGTVGDHVSKIHTALLVLERLDVPSDELRRGIYGPGTAAAVLKYKTRRGIINKSYQKAADDIVGKMTIAAMDRELLIKEKIPDRPLDPQRIPATT